MKKLACPNILACDPGVSGGFASVTQGVITPRLMAMPDTEENIVELIRWTCDKKTLVVIEQVSGFIGRAHPGSRMFTFGKNFGLILGAALALGLTVQPVLPQKWQKHYAFPAVKDRTERKKIFAKRAQDLYPNCRVTRATADALLILDYAISFDKK